MVWTRKSEAERDPDEIELATEKVSLPSFSFFLPPPPSSFFSLPSSCYPPPSPSLFHPSYTSEYALVHPPACSPHPRDVCLYTRVEVENTWCPVKVRFLWMQFTSLIVPSHSNPPYVTLCTTLCPAKRDNFLKASTPFSVYYDNLCNSRCNV